MEPTKHRYVSKAVKDDKEDRPTRYQTMTNQETYESFRENCSVEVGEIMLRHSEEMVKIYKKRKDSPHKNYRKDYACNILPNKFPSFSWWLEQRPCEVKTMHDHTTGLCKVNICSKLLYFFQIVQVCETARINYKSVLKTMKRTCR